MNVNDNHTTYSAFHSCVNMLAFAPPAENIERIGVHALLTTPIPVPPARSRRPSRLARRASAYAILISDIARDDIKTTNHIKTQKTKVHAKVTKNSILSLQATTPTRKKDPPPAPRGAVRFFCRYALVRTRSHPGAHPRASHECRCVVFSVVSCGCPTCSEHHAQARSTYGCHVCARPSPVSLTFRAWSTGMAVTA